METLYVNGNDVCHGSFRINSDWVMKFEDAEKISFDLTVVGVFPSMCLGPIFLFGIRDVFAHAGAKGAMSLTCAECLPAPCRQMLLCSPVVPLVKHEKGFQVICADDWMTLIVQSASDITEATLNASPMDQRPPELEEDVLDDDSTLTESDTPLDDINNLDDDENVDIEEFSDVDAEDVIELST